MRKVLLCVSVSGDHRAEPEDTPPHSEPASWSGGLTYCSCFGLMGETVGTMMYRGYCTINTVLSYFH